MKAPQHRRTPRSHRFPDFGLLSCSSSPGQAFLFRRFALPCFHGFGELLTPHPRSRSVLRSASFTFPSAVTSSTLAWIESTSPDRRAGAPGSDADSWREFLDHV